LAHGLISLKILIISYICALKLKTLKTKKMRTVSLSGSPRANVGRKDAAELRAKGQVPCVIYGGKEQIHFFADERAFKPVIYTPDACIVNISVAGKEYKAVLQDSQYHKLSDKLIHADFLEVVAGKPVAIQVPVKLLGQAQGVKDGGRLVLKLRKVKVSALEDKLPQTIDINIEPLTIGKGVNAGDINIEGVTLLHPKNISIVSVEVTRNVVEEVKTAAVTTAAATPAAVPAAAADKKPADKKK
jgi:large subunit ribosomal protein L25